jgi:hypothetical protein
MTLNHRQDSCPGCGCETYEGGPRCCSGDWWVEPGFFTVDRPMGITGDPLDPDLPF